MTPAQTTPDRTQAKDVMTKNPVTVSMADTVSEVARVFDSNEISGAPVIDGQGRVVGVVSKTDLLHRFVEGPDGSRGTSFLEAMAEGLGRAVRHDPDELGVVEDFMSPEPVTCTPDTAVTQIARLMTDQRVHRVIVVNASHEPVGVVTTLDLLRAFQS